MKTIFMVKNGSALVPAFPDDEIKLKKIKDGEVVKVEVKLTHSPRQHRAVFALAKTVLMNAPHDDSPLGKWGRLFMTAPEKTKYNFVKMCEVQLGYYDILIKPDGSSLIIPQSLSYDNMDRADFDMFFQGYLELCSKLLNVDTKDLIANYEED